MDMQTKEQTYRVRFLDIRISGYWDIHIDISVYIVRGYTIPQFRPRGAAHFSVSPAWRGTRGRGGRGSRAGEKRGA
ncbi:hypothetical protein CAEBREN_30680 [Caenorhabditis brenneri]|uniref:Uncharacterized protein n=1 Tax=Caenorhabditis brenneri TaxID=135651 RepID=G0P8E8_CAEBE|nr:hypothetical protein CAEBREN_30680 [Caenorhabditis brenneri]